MSNNQFENQDDINISESFCENILSDQVSKESLQEII